MLTAFDVLKKNNKKNISSKNEKLTIFGPKISFDEVFKNGKVRITSDLQSAGRRQWIFSRFYLIRRSDLFSFFLNLVRKKNIHKDMKKCENLKYCP